MTDQSAQVLLKIAYIQFAASVFLVSLGAALAGYVLYLGSSQPNQPTVVTAGVIQPSPSPSHSSPLRREAQASSILVPSTAAPSEVTTPTPAATVPPQTTTTSQSSSSVAQSLAHDVALAIIAAGATLLPSGAIGFAAATRR